MILLLPRVHQSPFFAGNTRLSSDKRTINVDIYQQKCIFWLLEINLEEVFGMVSVQESN